MAYALAYQHSLPKLEQANSGTTLVELDMLFPGRAEALRNLIIWMFDTVITAALDDSDASSS